MLDREARVAAVLKRTADLREARRKQRIGIGAAVLCLLIAIGIGVVVSTGLVARITEPDAGFSASILASGGSLGYIVVAILAFLLGVTATVICMLLNRRTERGKADRDRKD